MRSPSSSCDLVPILCSVSWSKSDALKYKRVRCRCNRKAVIRISKTNDNPNRLFHSCPDLNECKFFAWCDPINALVDLPNREVPANTLICNLLELQAEVRGLVEQVRGLQVGIREVWEELRVLREVV
ncbi:uncharacterized protein LOC122078603 [Macadamia integrifolia]|uniref:uncharacterized protein LOC122078603 n=1 Tax=Macadamia integrifolia TaxID=60698 RepID=UPI001C4FE7CE|nr:uncharacterized protein LOC122078603 [Macadamia integrifolia]